VRGDGRGAQPCAGAANWLDWTWGPPGCQCGPATFIAPGRPLLCHAAQKGQKSNCVYAVLSQVDKGQAKQHEDLAIDLLRRAVEMWRRGGVGLSEIEAIRWDPALRVLAGRSEFQKLLAEKGLE